MADVILTTAYRGRTEGRRQISHQCTRRVGGGRLTEREFNTTRKSVISAPAWPPTPTPARPIALGADQAKDGRVIVTARPIEKKAYIHCRDVR